MLGEGPVHSDEGCHIANRDIIGGNRSENTVESGTGRRVVIQVETAGRIPCIVDPGEHRNVIVEVVDIRAVPAGNSTELALPDQTLAEIGEQRQIAGAEKAR